MVLHYDDLKADLEGKMRELAARLGIEVDEGQWPPLVEAATFESMRSKADTTIPGGGRSHWIEPAAFFSRGTSGQWRDLLDDGDLVRYAARVRALASMTSSGGCTASRSTECPSGRLSRTDRHGRRNSPMATSDSELSFTSGAPLGLTQWRLQVTAI